MGSAASTKLKCPDKYDKTKFNMILKLYDQLDSNGDQVIETLELKNIANLHIKNRQTELSTLKIKEKNDYNYELEHAKLKYEKNIEKLNKKITDLDEMTEKQKCQKFLKVVSSDGKHIEFWKFFDYMHSRTLDIKNIDDIG